MLLRLFPFPVHVGQHHGDVGGEKVIHLVAEAGLTEQSATPNEATYGDVEIVGTTAPVRDLGEWMSGKNFLQRRKS